MGPEDKIYLLDMREISIIEDAAQDTAETGISRLLCSYDDLDTEELTAPERLMTSISKILEPTPPVDGEAKIAGKS